MVQWTDTIDDNEPHLVVPLGCKPIGTREAADAIAEMARSQSHWVFVPIGEKGWGQIRRLEARLVEVFGPRGADRLGGVVFVHVLDWPVTILHLRRDDMPAADLAEKLGLSSTNESLDLLRRPIVLADLSASEIMNLREIVDTLSAFLGL